jgi:hypothetical protein
MDRAEFERRMEEVDKQLAAQQCSAFVRPLLAWARLASPGEILGNEPELSSDPFVGNNLMCRIEEWYRTFFPVHSTTAAMRSGWGSRLFLIRGEVFRARIPLIFNARHRLDAFEYIDDLSDALRLALDENERSAIQDMFNHFYVQASDLNLCRTTHGAQHKPGIVGELIERGLADLRACCDAFAPNDPTAVMFSAQQAVEKYMKAFLVNNAPETTDTELRSKYGHGMAKLLSACELIDPVFSRVTPHIGKLAFGAEVRYQRATLGTKEVIDIVNLAYGVCHLIAKILLAQLRATSGKSDCVTHETRKPL